MSRKNKVIEKLLQKPTPKNVTWDEYKAFIEHYGYQMKNGKGSRRKFYKEEAGFGIPISVHEPHPDRIVLQVYVKQTIMILKENGDIK